MVYLGTPIFYFILQWKNYGKHTSLWKILTIQSRKNLKKFLKSHAKKRPYTVYRVFFPEIGKLQFSMDFYDDISKSIKRELYYPRLDSEEMPETMDFKYGKEIERQKKIWEKRNRIYLSLNEDLTDWITYKDINKEDFDEFHEYLNKQIEITNRFKVNLFVYVDNPPY